MISKLFRKYSSAVKWYKRNKGKKTTCWNYRHGFLPSTVELCGITKDNYTDFLSDRAYREGHPYNGPYTSIIDNKLYLPFFLCDYKEHLPEYYFYIDECGLLPLLEPKATRVDMDELFRLLDAKGVLALKHTHSSLGAGFYKLKADKGQYYLNNEVIEREKLASKILGLRNYIVTEYVSQHSYANEISSDSLNTMRFLCVWDAVIKSFFLHMCFHRFGCNGSVVDNVIAGNGILHKVDVEKGVLCPEGEIQEHNAGNHFMLNPVHPGTKQCHTGLQIPNFEQTKKKVIEIANRHSYLRYVGFDVAITQDGFKIIEINSLSSLDVAQLSAGGFLKDQRVRKVLKQ